LRSKSKAETQRKSLEDPEFTEKAFARLLIFSVLSVSSVVQAFDVFINSPFAR